MRMFSSSADGQSRRSRGKVREDPSSLPLHKRVLLIPTERIVPNAAQPRRSFSEESLRELAQSIEANGLLQPITVRSLEDGYELIAGERRLRAFRLLGRGEIPAIIEEMDAAQSRVLALIENIQRDDLGWFDQALAIRSLMDEQSFTQAEAARRLGMAQSTLANKLRLLKLDESLRERILAAGLTERHARCLLLLPTVPLQEEAAEEIIRREMNVAQAEQLVRRLLERTKNEQAPHQSRRFIPKDVRIFVNTIRHAVETMKSAGIEASTERTEDEQTIRYTVCISKTHGAAPAEFHRA